MDGGKKHTSYQKAELPEDDKDTGTRKEMKTHMNTSNRTMPKREGSSLGCGKNQSNQHAGDRRSPKRTK